MPRPSRLRRLLRDVPAVTLAVLGLNVYLFVSPAVPIDQACVSYFWNVQWLRLFLSPLHHRDTWHLGLNMASFLWKGARLERRVGGAWFLYTLSVFCLLTCLTHLLLQAELRKLFLADPMGAGFLEMWNLSSECISGFSGVLFALKVVNFHGGPVTYRLGVPVSDRLASWAELLLFCWISPNTSVLAHLAGSLVGLMFSVGPLETSMAICAELLSSLVRTLWSYFSPSGRPRRRLSAPPPPPPEEEEEEEEVPPPLEELRMKRLRRLEHVPDRRRRM